MFGFISKRRAARILKVADDMDTLNRKLLHIIRQQEAQLTMMARTPVNTQFTQAEIRTLISLAHPDKHQGKDSAVQMTQKLLQLRHTVQ